MGVWLWRAAREGRGRGRSSPLASRVRLPRRSSGVWLHDVCALFWGAQHAARCRTATPGAGGAGGKLK
eukprot:4155006-Prymnesium_polylepis.1